MADLPRFGAPNIVFQPTRCALLAPQDRWHFGASTGLSMLYSRSERLNTGRWAATMPIALYSRDRIRLVERQRRTRSSIVHFQAAQGTVAMQIRASLLPPTLDHQLVRQLTDLANQIVAAMNAGHDATLLIAEFNAATGQQFDRAAFHGAWEGGGMRLFVETLLRPPPQRVPDITDDELLEIITYLVEGRGTASEQSYWLEFLERNLPHPEVVNLIYWRFDAPAPAEILAEAKAYKPIQL